MGGWEHPAKVRERVARWRKANPGRHRAYFRVANRRPERREQVRRLVSAYTRRNPEWNAHRVERQRVRRIGNGGSHTLAEWREKCALLGNVCFYCGEAKPLTIEHKVPLVRGGSDDIANIVPACGSCNSKKGRRTAREYVGS
jgi:5-methylcytosine-specific restriction endonuclease McrA